MTHIKSNRIADLHLSTPVCLSNDIEDFMLNSFIKKEGDDGIGDLHLSSSMAIGDNMISAYQLSIDHIDFAAKKIFFADATPEQMKQIVSGLAFSIVAAEYNGGNKQNFDYNCIVDDIFPDEKSISASGLTLTSLNPVFEKVLWFPTKPELGNTLVSKNSLAIGDSCIVSQKDSLAVGDGCIAGGKYSVAVGKENNAGYAAFAEGQQTSAFGLYSHTEGFRTKVVGLDSWNTFAGRAGHAAGVDAVTEHKYAWTWSSVEKRNSPYKSHGDYTFNVNPKDGAKGFYVADRTLDDMTTHITGNLSVDGSIQAGHDNVALGECSYTEGGSFAAEAGTSTGNIALAPATHAEGAGENVAGTKAFQIVGFWQLSTVVGTQGEGALTASSYKNNRVAYKQNSDTLKDLSSFGNNLPLKNTIQISATSEAKTELDKIQEILDAKKTSPVPSFASEPLSISLRLKGNYDCVGEILSIVDRENGIISCSNISSNMMNWNTSFQGTEYDQMWLVNYPLIGDRVIGYGSHAEGFGTHAGHNGAHSEGRDTIASDKYAHAEGLTTKAHGYASHAEGEKSYAIGMRSHAEGNSTANGNWSHAEGRSTTNKEAYYAHAEGMDTRAEGRASHASGRKAIAREEHGTSFVWSCLSGQSYYSHANGSFNVNPQDGLNGFYVGENSLCNILDTHTKDLTSSVKTLTSQVNALNINVGAISDNVDELSSNLTTADEKILNLTDENEELKAKFDYYVIRDLKGVEHNTYKSAIDRSVYYQPKTEVQDMNSYALSSDMSADYLSISINTSNYNHNIYSSNDKNAELKPADFTGIKTIENIDFSGISAIDVRMNCRNFEQLTALTLPDQVGVLSYLKIDSTTPMFTDVNNLKFPKKILTDNAFYRGIYMQGAKLNGTLAFPEYDNINIVNSIKLHNSRQLSVVFPDNISSINECCLFGTNTNVLMMPANLQKITSYVSQSNNKVIDFSKCTEQIVNIHVPASTIPEHDALLNSENYSSESNYFTGIICIPQKWTTGSLSSQWSALSNEYGWERYASQLSVIYPPRTKEITVSKVVYDSEAGGVFAIGEGFTALKQVDGQRVMGYQTDELDEEPIEFESDTRVKLIAWDLPVDTDFWLQWQADPSAAEYKLDSHTKKFTVEAS